MNAPTALFPGTFDPVTLGHLDLVERAAGLFGRVVVSVSQEGRDTRFGGPERVALFREALGERERIVVEPFRGLIVDQARRHGARVLVRGVRHGRDLDREMQMAWANRHLLEGLETVFLTPSAGLAVVSASLVREVAALGGDVAAWVPPCVVRALAQRGPRRSPDA
jgi:pantetheine-phosphate adenylyltransferase